MFRKRKFLGIINFQGRQWQTYSIFLPFLAFFFTLKQTESKNPFFQELSSTWIQFIHFSVIIWVKKNYYKLFAACGIVSMRWMRYMNISGQLCLLYCFSPCVLDMSLWLSRACTLDSISTELSLRSRWLVNERQRFYASSVNCAQYRIWAVCPSEWPF